MMYFSLCVCVYIYKNVGLCICTYKYVNTKQRGTVTEADIVLSHFIFSFNPPNSPVK